MIRLATPADIPAILEIYGPNITNTTNSFEYTIPTLEEFHHRFHSITEQFPWLVWEEDGTVLGYAYASLPFHRAAYAWSCEVSIYVAPQAHKKGIGRRLYSALEQILFYQGYRVIYAVVTEENRDSVAFHERVGYRYVATLPGCGFKFGRQLGIVWLEKRSDSADIPHNPPISWSAIVENSEKFSHILATLSLS